MELAIQLYGYLILTFIGFTLPILTILLSVYNKGIIQLSKDYTKDKQQKEAQIRELAKSAEIDEIEKNIKDLKKINKATEKKLAYLKPKEIIGNLFALLLVSFFYVLLALSNSAALWSMIVYVLISLGLLIWAFCILFKLLSIWIEAKKITDNEKEKEQAEIVGLLSSIAERTEKSGTAPIKNVNISIDRVHFKNEKQNINVEVNKKQSLDIGFNNDEKGMVKNLEIGFIFTNDFIIERALYYNIYSDATQQIVRFVSDFVHGDTHMLFGYLNITPLKVGEYVIKTFIKAENIEATYSSFQLKVTAKTEESIKQ